MDKNRESGREAVLARFLRMPLNVRFVNRKVFHAGYASRDEVVTSSRLILIVAGEMTYEMERRTHRLRAGTQFFVPAWVRRMWRISGGGDCEIAWCEFDDDSTETGVSGCLRRRLDARAFALEKRNHRELLALYQKSNDDGAALRGLGMEAMLKAALGRFWTEAAGQPGSDVSMSAPTIHPAVKRVLRWFEENYQRPDALERAYADCDLTPNYLRRHFKDVLKSSPQAYLQRLRLRHARHLIHTTHWQQKRIAAEVGYDDPLYFSRLYARQWGRSPSEERALVAPRR